VRYNVLSKAGKWGLYLGLLAAGAAPVSAQESGAEDPWEFKAIIYLWGASINGTTRRDNEIDVSFSDVWDNLDFAVMGALEARKSKWSVAADVIHLGVSANNAGTIGPMGGAANADADVTGWVLNFQGARNVYEGERASVDLLAGARYLDIESKLTLSLPGPSGQNSFKSSGDVWDGVVGVKGKIKLTQAWFLPYYMDAGAGGSDLTWQALGDVGYAFSRVDLILAYRHIAWEFGSDNQFKDVSFSGPSSGRRLSSNAASGAGRRVLPKD
jgi:hypothetical protein